MVDSSSPSGPVLALLQMREFFSFPSEFCFPRIRVWASFRWPEKLIKEGPNGVAPPSKNEKTLPKLKISTMLFGRDTEKNTNK